jgi:Effector Associated Constant Component 1
MITEALVVALGSSGALFTLAGAVAAWIRRGHPHNVTIRVTGPDGKEITVQTKGPLSAEQMSLLVQHALDRPDASTDSSARPEATISGTALNSEAEDRN